jgi:branched-subunit amino acid transport protein
VAALAGVVAPEVVMQQGHLIASWQDARVFAAAAGAAAYFWRDSVLLTIVAGMAVYLPLHLALGW